MSFENESRNSTSALKGRGNSTGSSRNKPRNKLCYEIRFWGHLDDHWAAWFYGCSLVREEDGATTMVALVVDQAELFGLLNKVRDLSLSLISVNMVELHDDLESF